jgi:DNA recombination protein RmuC
VDAVAEYIRPEEQTVDYALMYIPGENIFHEIMRRDRGLDHEGRIWAYAHENRVIPASPNTLFLYIQTIALALRGLSVERSARQIQAQLTTLAKNIRQASGDVETLGAHLRNAQNKQQEISRRLSDLQQQVETPIALDPPE